MLSLFCLLVPILEVSKRSLNSTAAECRFLLADLTGEKEYVAESSDDSEPGDAKNGEYQDCSDLNDDAYDKQ